MEPQHQGPVRCGLIEDPPTRLGCRFLIAIRTGAPGSLDVDHGMIGEIGCQQYLLGARMDEEVSHPWGVTERWYG